MSFKKCPVVMLPTNEKASIFYKVSTEFGDYLTIVNNNTAKENLHNSLEEYQDLLLKHNWKPQHLYILSDEEIKEGNWFVNLTSQRIYQNDMGLNLSNNYPNEQKIIATTDENLYPIVDELYDNGFKKGIKSQIILPQPSQSFIKKFVEEYNKGNIITEVMVEYETYCIHGDNCPSQGAYNKQELCEIDYKLKINQKYNTITIKKVKDSWNKKDEDLRIAFEKFACDVYDENYKKDMSFKKRAELMSKQWIEENL